MSFDAVRNRRRQSSRVGIHLFAVALAATTVVVRHHPYLSWDSFVESHHRRSSNLRRHCESLCHCARLIDGLLVFQLWVRVGDNTRASLKVGFPVFQHGAAQRDARIEITVEPKITDRARVAAASGLFQVSDNLHGADFRCARHRASGKCSLNEIKRSAAGAQTPGHIRNDVHDVTVTLDLHHLGHTHCAEIRNSSNIVARKIDKHDVLGAFLGIGEQFRSVAFVLCCGRTAGARPRDWANLNRFVCQPDMHLRRAANERKIVSFKTKHVRRGINETEAAIKIERVTIEIGLEALRQDNLKDVAAADVFLSLFNCPPKLLWMKIAANRMHLAVRIRDKSKIRRFRELVHDGTDRFCRLRVDFFERAIVEKCIHGDLQAAEPMIENEKAVCNHEERLGQLELIPGCNWNLGLEETDCFVPKKTDSAASEARQFRTRDELITRHQFAQLVEWVSRYVEPLLATAFGNSNFVTVALDDNPWFGPNEREPARHIIIFRRFKEEAVIAAIELLDG